MRTRGRPRRGYRAALPLGPDRKNPGWSGANSRGSSASGIAWGLPVATDSPLQRTDRCSGWFVAKLVTNGAASGCFRAAFFIPGNTGATVGGPGRGCALLLTLAEPGQRWRRSRPRRSSPRSVLLPAARTRTSPGGLAFCGPKRGPARGGASNAGRCLKLGGYHRHDFKRHRVHDHDLILVIEEPPAPLAGTG